MSAFVINPYSFVSDNITAFSFLQATTSTANATIYTFTSVNFGTADSNRRIVVGVAARGGTSTISSATIGGVSATILAQCQGSNNGLGYIAADVPTGATGTVEVTLTNAAGRMGIATYRIVSNAALTLADTDQDVAAGFSKTLSIDAENGIVLAAGKTGVGSVVLSFSGIATTDVNTALEANSNLAFASERTTATTTQTVTVTGQSGTNVIALGLCLT